MQGPVFNVTRVGRAYSSLHLRLAPALLPGLLLTILCSTGCWQSGPPVVEVRGTVTYRGEPVPHGSITFVPVATSGEVLRPATGMLSEDGSYEMQAFPGRSGTRPGEYRVSVLSYTGSFMDGTVKYIVPQQYSNPQTSGLT